MLKHLILADTAALEVGAVLPHAGSLQALKVAFGPLGRLTGRSPVRATATAVSRLGLTLLFGRPCRKPRLAKFSERAMLGAARTDGLSAARLPLSSPTLATSLG